MLNLRRSSAQFGICGSVAAGRLPCAHTQLRTRPAALAPHRHRTPTCARHGVRRRAARWAISGRVALLADLSRRTVTGRVSPTLRLAAPRVDPLHRARGAAAPQHQGHWRG